MASSPKSTTSTTTTEPWQGSKEAIVRQYGVAERLAANGTPNYYPGSTVIDQSQATTDALRQMEERARSSTSLIPTAQNAVTNVTNGSTFDPTANATYNRLQAPTDTGTDPFAGVYNRIANMDPNSAPGQQQLARMAGYQNPGLAATFAAMGLNNNDAGNALMRNGLNYSNPAMAAAQGMVGSSNNGARSLVEQTANGSMLNSNPYFDQTVKQANQGVIDQYKTQISPGLDAAAGAIGRTGSGAAAATRGNAETNLFNTLSKNANDMYSANFQNERVLQTDAQKTLANIYNTDWSNNAQAVQTLGAMSDSQNAARNAALGQAGNLTQQYAQTGLAGAGQLGSLSDSQNAQQLAAIGQMQGTFQNGIQNNLAGAQAGSAAFNNDQQRALAAKSLSLDAARAQTAADGARSSAMLQGASQAGDAYNLGFAPSEQLAKVGAARDAYADILKQADIAKWDQNENKQWDNVARMMSVLTGGGYNSATTTKPVYSNPMGEAIGAAGSVASILSLLCDVRLKENIKEVGVLKGGIREYEFNYKFDKNKRVRGPMAQEVEVFYPEAVYVEFGVKHVNMTALMEAINV